MLLVSDLAAYSVAELPGAGRAPLMQDMDDRGASFRPGSTRRWYEEDAEDASAWRKRYGLFPSERRPTFRLRQA